MIRSSWIATVAVLACAAAQAQVTISDPPPEHSFGKVPIGATYATQYFSVFNTGSAPVALGQLRIEAAAIACLAIFPPACGEVAPGDFDGLQNSDGCSNRTLAPGTGCSALVRFVPKAAGERLASLVVPVTSGGASISRLIRGIGVSNPTDCVLDWAERTLPQFFTAPASPFVISSFHARCYGGAQFCAGTDTVFPTVAPPSVYLFQNGTLSRYAALADVARQATYPGSTRTCDQSPP